MGDDLLWGGKGQDTFVLGENQGSNWIDDFTDGEDFIGLTGGLTFEKLQFTLVDNNTLIQVSSTGEVLATLKGFNPNLLTSEDFISLAFNPN